MLIDENRNKTEFDTTAWEIIELVLKAIASAFAFTADEALKFTLRDTVIIKSAAGCGCACSRACVLACVRARAL